MAKPAAAEGGPASFFDVVGQGIIDTAGSLEAHFDADALVTRLSAEAKPTSKRAASALSELRVLSESSPAAVAATRDAVPAILRALVKLTPSKEEDDLDDEAEDPLRDALDALACLMIEPTGAAGSKRSGGQDGGAARRGKEVAELTISYTEKGRRLFILLGIRSIPLQYAALVLLQKLYDIVPEPIDEALPETPGACGSLMQLLHCPIDYVRNESLGFLILLTSANTVVQTIMTVQGLVETIFVILEEEDLTLGGKVARDLLRCFMNLVGNSTCQRHIRETGGLMSLVSAMSAALLGRDTGEEEGDDDDVFGPDRTKAVPEELRWTCLGLLVDAALAFAGKPAPGAAEASGVMHEAEVTANQDSLLRSGVLPLLRSVSDPKISVAAKLRLVQLLDALALNAEAARRLQSYEGDKAPILFVICGVLVGPDTDPQLRNGLSRVVGTMVPKHQPLQSFICSSLSPQLEDQPAGGVPPAGRQVVSILTAAADGHGQPERVWFASHLMLATLLDNADVQSVCTSMPTSIPSDAGPSENFLELTLRAFSASARACSSAMGGDEPDGFEARAAASGVPDGPSAPAAMLLALMKLLTCWLASCSSALPVVANSPVYVPLLFQLITLGSICGNFFQVQVEGLAAFLIGICIRAQQGDVDVASLMSLLAKRVGIEEFQQKTDRLWRSEPLQRPGRGFADFCWYAEHFRTFIREQQRGVQRRMVQLYVAGGVGDGGASLSEDVADHYKQIIRVQDAELQEVKAENEHLRKEVDAFMNKALQASSAALVEKMNALKDENEALHDEVGQLEQTLEDREMQLETQLRRSNASISELEKELQSLVVGYEQVERASEVLSRENAELKARGLAAGAAPAPPSSALSQRVEELQAERADLLDLLGRILARCPEARQLVAPLGAAAALGSAPSPGGTTLGTAPATGMPAFTAQQPMAAGSGIAASGPAVATVAAVGLA